MGPLAGPVVAAAVVFPPGTPARRRRRLEGADARPQREELAARSAGARSASASPSWSRRRSTASTSTRPACAPAARGRGSSAPSCRASSWSTGGRSPASPMPQSAYPKGDAFVSSIAAASIVAKVYRDALMRELDARYPATASAGTWATRRRRTSRAIREHGPSPDPPALVRTGARGGAAASGRAARRSTAGACGFPSIVVPL